MTVYYDLYDGSEVFASFETKAEALACSNESGVLGNVAEKDDAGNVRRMWDHKGQEIVIQ